MIKLDRMTAVFAAIIMLLSCGVTAYAETCGSFEYTVKSDGSAAIKRYTADEVSAIIPETIDGRPVTELEDYSFTGNLHLKEISIPKTVTRIGSYAFGSCYKLASLTVPSSCKVIDSTAFMYCRELAQVSLPYGLETIGENAFLGCDALSELTIPASVQKIGLRAVGYTSDSLWNYIPLEGFTVKCRPKTAAARYVLDNGLRYWFLPDPDKGDVNGDGDINMKDYARLQRFLNGWQVEADEWAADLNDDGSVNMKDYSLLQRQLNGAAGQ